MSAMITKVYISTGAKNAMFTLRVARELEGRWYVDGFVKILSKFAMKAEELAKQYTEELAERINMPVIFDGFATEGLAERRGKLSAMDTKAIMEIERGNVPFGKNKGMKISELSDNYLLWLTDELKKPDLKPAFFSFALAGSGIAHERGLIAMRDAARLKRQEEDMKSEHYGVIGNRYTLDLLVEYANRDEETGYTRYQFRDSFGSILFHNGQVDFPKGETVKIKFTVKFHNVTKTGIKKTYINRPTLVK